MRKQLSQDDIKILRYECRPRIVASFVIFVVGSIILTSVASFIFPDISFKVFYAIITGQFILSVLIGFMLCSSFVIDIRNGEKLIQTKVLKKKIDAVSYEAGSASYPFPHNREMKEVDVYYFVIENTKYMVDEDLFKACEEGDKIEFHMAPRSNSRIRMTKSKTSNNRFQ